MKQKIGTFVLFGLLILTVVALTKIGPTHATAQPSTSTTVQQALN